MQDLPSSSGRWSVGIEGFSTAMLRFLEVDAVVIVLGNVEQRNPVLMAQALAEKPLFE